MRDGRLWMNAHRNNIYKFIAFSILSVGTGAVSALEPSYGVLGLGVTLMLALAVFLPTRWFLWGCVFIAPLDIYRIDAGIVNLSLYRVFLLLGAVSWAVRVPLYRASLRSGSSPFAFLFGTFAFSNAVWFFTGRYGVVGFDLMLNLLSGMLLVFLFYMESRTYEVWRRGLDALLMSGVWVILALVYTYAVYFATGRVVAQIPLRKVIPIKIVSAGEWLAKAHRTLGFPRLTLPYGSPPHLSGFLAAFLSLLIVLYLYGSRKRRRGWWLGCIALFLVALAATFSRTGWLAFLGGVIVVNFQLLRSGHRIAFRNWWWAVLFLGLVVAAIVLAVPSEAVESVLYKVSAIREIPFDRTSRHWTTRLHALQIWLQNIKTFLLGVGFSNYELHSEAVHSHSPYTTVLAERGLVGSLLFWTFYLGTTLYIGRESFRWYRADRERFAATFGVFVATVVTLFGSLFYEYLYMNLVWILFALAASAMRFSDRDRRYGTGGHN